MGLVLRHRRRFTGEEVDRFADAGLLHDANHLELIDGDLVVNPPQGPPHGALMEDLRDRLRDAYRAIGAHVTGQRPIVIDRAGRHRPEPDIAVVPGVPRDYLKRHPRGDEAILVVEIAVSSLRIARSNRVQYARGGVAHYWVFDVVGEKLEVHTDPERRKARYATCVVLSSKDDVKLPRLAVRFSVESMLPR